jgi:hypothetical protein
LRADRSGIGGWRGLTEAGRSPVVQLSKGGRGAAASPRTAGSGARAACPEAEQLLAGREEHPSSLRALAQLRIAEGQPQIAAALLERGLRAAEGDAIRATQLLAPLVDARLACEDAEGAEAAARELGELARSSGIGLVWARADLAAARVALAAGRASQAAEPARRALATFSGLGMPLDTGEARLELGRALAGDAPNVAREEARTAFAAFPELGASRAMDGAAAVLRDLGSGTAPPHVWRAHRA